MFVLLVVTLRSSISTPCFLNFTNKHDEMGLNWKFDDSKPSLNTQRQDNAAVVVVALKFAHIWTLLSMGISATTAFIS